MKPLLAIALACVLLACPLRCAIGGCQDGGLSDVDSSQCECCLPPSSQDQDTPGPALPASDCDCESCICDGAIPVNSSLRDYRATGQTLTFSPPIACQVMQGPTRPTRDLGTANPNANRFHGDNTRVAFSRWIL